MREELDLLRRQLEMIWARNLRRQLCALAVATGITTGSVIGYMWWLSDRYEISTRIILFNRNEIVRMQAERAAQEKQVSAMARKIRTLEKTTTKKKGN